MQTVTINTTQNIGIEYEIANLGQRILARLIDSAIFIAVVVLIVLIGTSMGSFISESVGIGVGIVLGAIYVFYDLICETFFSGQSAGKRVMNIRVVSLTGSRPTFSQYLLRWLFRIVDFSLSGNVGALLCAALNKNTQRIGDIVANTVVIRTQGRTKFEHIAFKPADDDYVPVFAEAINLDDKDISLINEVIATYARTGNAVVVYTTANKLKEVLGVTTPAEMNDMLFLQTLIKDYSHMVAANEQLTNS